MALIKNGANGTFSGKVGSIVGYEWKGKGVIRGLPRINKHRKASELELANREKMRLMQYFLQASLPFIRLGYVAEAKARNMSAFNAAMSYNKKNAFKGDYPNIQIDFASVLLSRGVLPIPVQTAVSAAENGVLFTWDKSVVKDSSFRTILYTYSEDENLCTIAICNGYADKGEEMLRFNWNNLKIRKGTEVHAFMAFVTVLHDKISDSVYCGSITY